MFISLAQSCIIIYFQETTSSVIQGECTALIIVHYYILPILRWLDIHCVCTADGLHVTVKHAHNANPYRSTNAKFGHTAYTHKWVENIIIR